MRSQLPKIKYLGQIIDEKSWRTNPSRANIINNIPAPTSVLSLQSFLGLASYYY